MKSSIRWSGWLALALGLQAANVAAVELKQTGVQGGRPVSKVPSTQGVQPSGKLLDGVISRLDLPAGKVEIQGQWLTISPGRTQLFQGGHTARPDALRIGQAVRYTTLGDAADKRLGVLYAQ